MHAWPDLSAASLSSLSTVHVVLLGGVVHSVSFSKGGGAVGIVALLPCCHPQERATCRPSFRLQSVPGVSQVSGGWPAMQVNPAERAVGCH